MKKFLGAASAAVVSLGIVACDSAAENAVEEEVSAAEDLVDAQIDEMEAAGQISEEQAEAMEEAVAERTDVAMDALDEADPETLYEAEAIAQEAMEAAE